VTTASAGAPDTSPLAERMRPQRLEDVLGQDHLLAEGRPLRRALAAGRLHSMVFWGPPGTGKTTLARLVASNAEAGFVTLSAVLSGVKEIRVAIDAAAAAREQGMRTVLFVDEVHRFNKAQQDSFLPHIENGTIVFIGATTENPAFELNSALLSRLRVYVLKPVDAVAIMALLERACRLLTTRSLPPAQQALISEAADGDARRALNLLEIALDLSGGELPDDELLREVLAGGARRRFDKGGEVFYDQISALHKSVRGSDPDAALYWFARMLDGGVDPLYIARRVVRIASEDVGNADPRAIALALDAWDVQQRLGSPEGELAIAQALVYAACCAKSNAVYKAFNSARAAVASSGTLEVPMALRNAPTELQRRLGHGDAYRYAHDEPEGYAAGARYLPESLAGSRWYVPVDRGLERQIGEKLRHLRQLDAAWLKGGGKT
jgi:putative ATPase